MQSAGVLILGHPLIACMLLILFAYFLKRAFIDFYFIFLSECADPVLFKFRLIVARDSTAHVGNFFGSIDYSSVIATLSTIAFSPLPVTTRSSFISRPKFFPSLLTSESFSIWFDAR